MADAVLGSASPQQPMADPTNAAPEWQAGNLGWRSRYSRGLFEVTYQITTNICRCATANESELSDLKSSKDYSQPSFNEVVFLRLS
jgi:hypothetical protein